MAIVTKEQLENAAIDAATLEQVVNNEAGSGTITTRLGTELQPLAEIQEENAVSSAKSHEWATKTDAIVVDDSPTPVNDYSSKEYAKGSQAGTGGSSKNWAQQTGGDVTGAPANSRSAKAYAQDNLTGATLGGSAKDWAQTTGGAVDGSTGRSAKSFAQEDLSSTGANAGGSSKDWAQGTGLIDGASKSAKGYAADAAAAAASVVSVTPAGFDLLNNRTNGITELFESPNQFPDHNYDRLSVAGTTQVNMKDGSAYFGLVNYVGAKVAATTDGRPGLSVTCNNTNPTVAVWANNLAALGLVIGDTVTISGRITSRTGTDVTGGTAVQLRQYTSLYGTENTGLRQIYSIPNAASFTGDKPFSITTTVGASVLGIGIGLACFSNANAYVVTDLCFVKGAATGYRPQLKDNLLNFDSMQLISARTEGVTELFNNPNIYPDPSYYNQINAATTRDSNGVLYSKSGALTIAAALVDGRAGFSIASTSGTVVTNWRAPLSTFGLVPGDKVSFSCRISSRTGTNPLATTKMRQFSVQTSGTEISAAGVTQVIPGNLPGDYLIKMENITVDATADGIGMQWQVGVTDAYTVSNVCFVKGAVADFRPVVETYMSDRILRNMNGTYDIITQPNLINNDWAVTSPLMTGAVTRTVVKANGRNAIQIDYNTTEPYLEFPISAFPSGYISVCGTLAAHTSNNGRLILNQLTSGNVQTSQNILGQNIGPTTKLPGRVSGTYAVDGTAAKVRFYISGYTGTGVSGTDSATWQDVGLFDGQNAAFRPYISLAGSSTAASTVQVISPTGSDAAAGTLAAPKKTLNAAKNALPNKRGTIICLRGVYGILETGETGLNMSDSPGIRVVAAARHKVRFNFGAKAGTITKTGGYTNIYQFTSTTNFGSMGFGAGPQIIFEDGTPFGAITAAYRHPLQRGFAYRCPDYAPYVRVASMALCDSTPGSFYAADGSTTGSIVYFHTLNNDSGVGKNIYVPAVASLVSTPATPGVTEFLEVYGIEARYSLEGINPTGCSYFYYKDVRVIGSDTGGGLRTGGTMGRAEDCEAAACNTDGWGDAVSAIDISLYRDERVTWSNLWLHDNFDDGQSSHNTCNGQGRDSLSEFNGGDGFVPAYGAQFTGINLVARANGDALGSRGKGVGLAVVGSPTGSENTTQTTANYYNCESYDNVVANIMSNSDGNIINAHKCVVGAITGAGGVALSKIRASTSTTINLYDCTDRESTNGQTLKSVAGSGPTLGVINVKNSVLIT